VKSTYLYLSNRLNLRHTAVFGSPHQAFAVNAGLFEAKLGEVLTRRAHGNPIAA
jgi:hypothetical protein